MSRVWVAMSGGVDSSVAAGLLLRDGHEVTGVTLQLLPEGEGPGMCCGTDGVRSARRVCDTLGIPHYTWNAREVFDREVIAPYADAYARGLTPNPCAACNDRIKFSWMLSKALAGGAEFLATGHYARIESNAHGSWLARGEDPGKDQSYFLYALDDQALARVKFPLGALTKVRVREIARELALPAAERPESQDACFVTADTRLDLIRERKPEALTPGDIVDEQGEVIGSHDGVAAFTVGQRKGIGVGGGAAPRYVTGIDAAKNRVYVGHAAALDATQVEARCERWAPSGSGDVRAMVRYRMEPLPVSMRRENDVLKIEFARAVRGVAPGQAIVCYEGDRVVAGGEIVCAR